MPNKSLCPQIPKYLQTILCAPGIKSLCRFPPKSVGGLFTFRIIVSQIRFLSCGTSYFLYAGDYLQSVGDRVLHETSEQLDFVDSICCFNYPLTGGFLKTTSDVSGLEKGREWVCRKIIIDILKLLLISEIR